MVCESLVPCGERSDRVTDTTLLLINNTKPQYTKQQSHNIRTIFLHNFAFAFIDKLVVVGLHCTLEHVRGEYLITILSVVFMTTVTYFSVLFNIYL